MGRKMPSQTDLPQETEGRALLLELVLLLAAIIAVLHLLQGSVAVRYMLALVRHPLLARLVELLRLLRPSISLMR